MLVFCFIVILISVFIIYKQITYNQEINSFTKNSKSNSTQKYATFITNVAGVTFDNEDGTSRQKLIQKLCKNDDIILEPYIYENEDAIYVKNVDNQTLGNIPKEAVKNITEYIDYNLILKVSVDTVNKFLNKNNVEIFYLKICLYLDSNNIANFYK